jgi:hypothetical protein
MSNLQGKDKKKASNSKHVLPYFYGKQDYSEEGQKRKERSIEKSLDRRVMKSVSGELDFFNFELVEETKL